MTRDDTIRMAREAGFREPNPHDGCLGLAYDYRDGTDTGASLERFAALVAAAEREACAITAWSAGMDAHNAARGLPCDARDVGSKAASAIRARGEPATREERRAHDERYLQATVEQTRTGRFA